VSAPGGTAAKAIKPSKTPLWVGIGLLLVAMSMRLPVGSVGPILDEIRHGVGLSNAGAGLLTTLPLLCFGVMAMVAPVLARRFGDQAILLACLVAVIVGTSVRALPHVSSLFGGTLMLGVAIAIANVLLPSVIKRDYARPGMMLGLYTMVLTGSAALAAGLTVPLMHAFHSWEWALAVWALPVALAIFVWLPTVRRAGTGSNVDANIPSVRLWNESTAWYVTGFMGMQSLLFYVLISWLPDILRDSGLTPSQAGLMLSIALLFGLPASLLAPIAAARLPNQRSIVLAAAACWLVGLVGMLVSARGATLVWMIALGLGQGTAFGLSLTLIVVRAPDGPHAAALSGMAQSVGYLLASVGPVAVGLVHGFTHGWTAAIWILLAATAAELFTGLGASRPRMVGSRSVPALASAEGPTETL
jgi:CP family cyanate transporter-like MFS transporter